MKRNKKLTTVTILILIIGLILLSAGIAYAAYYGRGSFKDVFVNRKYIFASDYLVESSDIIKAEENKMVTVNEIHAVHVYNYDVSTGDYDNFDIEYDVYAWMSDDTRNYMIEIGGTEYAISSTTPVKIKEGILLEKDKQSSTTINIHFDVREGDDYSKLPSINIAVESTSPKFLGDKVLASNFSIKESDEFNIECGFEYKDTDYTYDYAAFTYNVLVNGDPQEDEIKLLYDSNKLKISNWSLNENVSINPENSNELIVKISKDVLIEIVFFRTDDEYWDSELTFPNKGWEKVTPLVSKE